MKINTQEHRTALINLYQQIVANPFSTSFEKLLFENATNKLKNGCSPKKVEDWVVACEKLWRKTIK